MALFEELEGRSREAKQLANKLRDLGYHEASRLYGIEAKVWLEAASIVKQHKEQTNKEPNH